jgi:CPA1 family monovalent cation:H+ antiporter
VATLAFDGVVVALTVIVSRVVWVTIISRAPWEFDGTIEEREGSSPPLSWALVLGWAGMRGIVSLAAALAVPHDVIPNVPFPARDLIQFITFVTILVTLVGQGLTLPLVIAFLKVREEDASERAMELARLRMSEAGLKRLEQLEPSFVSTAHWEIAGKLRSRFEERMLHDRAHVEGVGMDGEEARHAIARSLFGHVLSAERTMLVELRLRGEINDTIYRRLQYEIDLEESLLA